MVASEAVKVLLPNVKRNVPGGGSIIWRVSNRGVIASVGLASKGFLKLQRNVKVEGMEKFLNILENNRDRGVITGTFLSDSNLCGSIKSFISVLELMMEKLTVDLTIRYFGAYFLAEFFSIRIGHAGH
jgi:hypothetical protein